MGNNELHTRQWEMEIEAKLSNIDTNVQELTIAMEKHISLSEGLDLPKRMTDAEKRIDKSESNIEKKPSWSGISSALGALSLIIGMIYMVAKGGL